MRHTPSSVHVNALLSSLCILFIQVEENGKNSAGCPVFLWILKKKGKTGLCIIHLHVPPCAHRQTKLARDWVEGIFPKYSPGKRKQAGNTLFLHIQQFERNMTLFVKEQEGSGNS